MKSTRQQVDFLNTYVADGGFLQSREWMDFQECAGKKTVHFEGDDGLATIIEHTLPLVGNYWYIPRGPVIAPNAYASESTKQFLRDIIARAKKAHIGWIRIEPADEAALQLWAESIEGFVVKKAAHDMQPKEIMTVSLKSDEAEMLAQMKSKTRYNIRLAQKKGVRVFTSHEQKDIDTFCDLVNITAKRDGIVPHPREYYRSMLQTIPDDMLKLYLAEYDGNIVAANLVVFFGTCATYMHGASGNDSREVMAPYLLQWRQMTDAKAVGCTRYDFGGVRTEDAKSAWAGITRFKQGFALAQKPTNFLGSYDVVIAKNTYRLYRILQSLTSIRRYMRKIV